MTTLAEEASARAADADHATDEASAPRVRRFAPRRSRSAPAPLPTSSPEPEHDQPIPVVAAAAESTPATRSEAPSPQPTEERATKSTRTRARRKATPPSAEAESTPAMLSDAPPSVPLDEIAPATPLDEAAPEPTPPTRPARSRGRRQVQRAAVTTLPDADPTPVAPAPPVALETPPVASEPVTVVPETPPDAKRARRPRRQPARATAAEQPATLEADPAVVAAQADDATPVPANTWFPDGEMTEAAPGGDLDRLETLARAFLETFPPEAPETALAVEPADLPAAGDEAEPAGVESALGEAEDIEGGEDAAGRRRSRRGRRGGRGRKRPGLVALTPVEPLGSPEPLPAEQENGHAAIEQTPPALGGPTTALFTPEQPPRPTRSWRERGPRRLWGRTYSRDVTPPVVMPPPKPSNGARFAPIPQAVPPRVSPVEPSVPTPTPFLLPELRLDEPLAPGETRTERLLEAQTYLLRAMLEQQARQIDVLTGQVTSLSRQFGRLAEEGIGARTYQPRTGIFVDAPNLCYAAEGARVNLDFGRMLRYLSRDRHLVHAFAYSPIIDDVREGIRYETQRFVAPFLRTGYKLVTKPLKRFSDGSAKGNFDIEMAVDIVTMSERLDLVVLISGDSDFERMIQHVQSRGVRVEVVAFASNVSTELVNVADAFIDISQHLDHMRVL